jgi:Tfp pilus assembly protein PilX
MASLGKVSKTQRATAQRGAVLIVALIALVIMSLAGISLVRSVDTANVIAGNMAFKKASTSLTDLGVQIAFTTLSNIPTANRGTNAAGNGTTQCPYVAAMTATPGWGQVTTNVPADYQVQCAIDRLCQDADTTLGINNIDRECLADPRTSGKSKSESSVAIFPYRTIYYRIRVQVTGPRNTVSQAEATVSL